jgi:hypothetical protein
VGIHVELHSEGRFVGPGVGLVLVLVHPAEDGRDVRVRRLFANNGYTKLATSGTVTI